MIRILLTGAEGAIGRALYDELTRAGSYEVIRTKRGTEFREMPDNSYSVDLRDPQQVERLMSGKPDWVIHCAARWTGLNDDFTILDDNVRMTLNITRYLPRTVSRLVYLSSSAVSRRLKGAYAVGKACEEQIVAARCAGTVRYTIWRPYHVVSPYEAYCPGRSHLVTNLAYEILERRAPRVDLRDNGGAWMRLTWVFDLTSAIVSNLDRRPENRTYDIGTTECRLVAEIAACIVEWGLKARMIDTAPDLIVGAVRQPCEPYEPDVVCATAADDTIKRCLAARYANAHI